MPEEVERRWLLLIHQIPPHPGSFRVKVWRRIQRLGAVAIKNSVYVLPANDQALEDFQWVRREIEEGGGEASICEARFAQGLSDAQVEALFHAARDADYAQLAGEARRLRKGLPSPAKRNAERRAAIELELVRLKKRLVEIRSIDFFGAPARDKAHGALQELEASLGGTMGSRKPDSGKRIRLAPLRGRTWVTRKGIHVDRMASAWLIRRFIDPEASFKFVSGEGYRPEAGELRFDMFDAEFTHEADRCTFEVLLDCFGLENRGLRPVAELVHDIDLKDSKFARPETPGVGRLIAGISLAHPDDEARLARGMALFDDFYEGLKRERKGGR